MYVSLGILGITSLYHFPVLFSKTTPVFRELVNYCVTNATSNGTYSLTLVHPAIESSPTWGSGLETCSTKCALELGHEDS